MEEYNEDKLQSLLDNRLYTQAADYLRQFQANSIPKQQWLNNEIRKLSIKGEKEAAYKSKVDKQGREAYDFVLGLNGEGIIPHTQYDDNGNIIPDSSNSYGDEYTKLVTNLKVPPKTYEGGFIYGSSPSGYNSHNGEQINYLRAEINDDYFNTFLNNLEVDNIDTNALGLEHTSNNGKHIISIPTNSKNLTKFLKAYNKTERDYALSQAGKAVGVGVGSAATGAAIGFAIGGPLGATIGGAGALLASLFGISATADPEDMIMPMHLKGSINNQTEVKLSNIHRAALDRLIAIENNARDKVKEDESGVGSSDVFSELTVSQFFGTGDVELYNAYKNGTIDPSAYENLREQRRARYDELLSHVDLTQTEVWSISDEGMDDDKGLVLQKVEKSSDKKNLTQDVLLAIQEKRVRYAVGFSGGRYGTVLSIMPRVKEDGTVTREAQRLFVPGLFQSTCDATIEADTKFMSYADYSDMKAWNYGRRLEDGTYVGYCKDLNAYKIVKDDYGNEVKVPITDSEMLHHLNRENIIQSCAQGVLQDLYLNKDYEHARALATYQAQQAVDELYPSNQYDDAERLYQANRIYNSILKLANYKQDITHSNLR